MYRFTILSATQNDNWYTFFDHFFSQGDISHKLISNAMDEKDLFSKALHFFPDIILLDADFPCENFFSVIDQLHEKLSDCEIILICSEPSNDFLIEAIHRHVFDIITAPLTEEVLYKTLQHDFIRSKRLSENYFSFTETNLASRRLFIYKDAYEEQTSSLSLSQINEHYGTFFKNGIFRGLIIKMDYPSNIMSIFENNQLRNKIINIIKKNLSSLCYDILFDKLSDGVYILLNYPNSQHENINQATQKMFSEIKDTLQFLYGIIVTMCISKEYTDLTHFQDIKKEVFDTRYFRIYFGTNKVLSSDYKVQQQISSQQEKDLHALYLAVVQAFRALNIPDCLNKLKSFFSYVKNNNINYTSEVRLYIRHIIDSIFELYTKEINCYTSAAELKHEFIYRVNMAFSFDRIQSTFLEHVPEILTNVSDIIQKNQHCKPVTDAILFIQKNYSKDISLDQLADMTGLTPSYFSALFKKETGTTLSNYLIRYRLDIAQQQLRNTHLSISEIAASVGYPDVKYFSRIFKKQLNTTPSEFRKLP